MATLARRIQDLEDAFKAFKASGGAVTDYGPAISGLQTQIGQIPTIQATAAAQAIQITALQAADTAASSRLDDLEALPVVIVQTTEPTHDGSQKDGDLWVKKT